MTVATRRVRMVALTAPSESFVHRGATMLADALRMATLAGATPGRLLVVRSLSVGDIHVNASPATLALSIERRVAMLDATAVRYEDAAATRSAAVFFDDDAEPYVALALRLACRQPVDAWFWPLAVPGWRAATTRDDGLRAILLGVLRTRAGPGALLRLVDALCERSALDPVLEVLRAADGAELLRELGWSAPPARGSAPVVDDVPAPRRAEGHRATSLAVATPVDATPRPGRPQRGGARVSARWASVIERWSSRWSIGDPRWIWLVAMGLVAEQPSRLADSRLMADAYHAVVDLVARRPVVLADELSTAPSPPGSPVMAGSDSDEAGTRNGDEANARGSTRTAETTAPEGPAAPGARASTVHAGLFFVIPIMTRLGMASFLEAHPHLVETDLARRVLDRLGERLAIPADDPVRSAVGPVTSADVAETDFVVPARWLSGLARDDELIVRRWTDRGSRLLLDRSGTLPIALWRGRAPVAVRALARGARLRRGRALAPGETDVDLLTAAWLSAIRRWSRRYAGMGLGTLARRPGRVVATPTHVDVELAHRDADVRIRRAGLDLDPGWVPWLGRVVRFHYRDD